MSDQIVLDVELRAGGKDDLAFLYETWLKGAKRAMYEVRRVRDRVYFKRHHDIIEGILARGARFLVAHPQGDPDTILGYVVAETAGVRPVIHYCYVKLPWRRLGIATRLITAAVPDPNCAIFTYWTSWQLAVPAPKGTDRGDRRAVRDARVLAVREAERTGGSGGDTEDLLRKWAGATYDPEARHDGLAWDEVA